MLQSQKIEQLQNVLSKSQQLKQLLCLIRQILSKPQVLMMPDMTQSSHYHYLKQYIQKFQIPQLIQILSTIRQPPCIVALPIKVQTNFTLFFVLVPSGQKFDWHSHPKMAGISKCAFGNIKIETIQIHSLQFYNIGYYFYPKNRTRIQLLTCKQNCISTIQPHSYNIHKIQATTFSAFFDLLMPDYPQNLCQFFTTVQQDQNSMLLASLNQPLQQVSGWDEYLKLIYQQQKHIVKNVIIK